MNKSLAERESEWEGVLIIKDKIRSERVSVSFEFSYFSEGGVASSESEIFLEFLEFLLASELNFELVELLGLKRGESLDLLLKGSEFVSFLDEFLSGRGTKANESSATVLRAFTLWCVIHLHCTIIAPVEFACHLREHTLMAFQIQHHSF